MLIWELNGVFSPKILIELKLVRVFFDIMPKNMSQKIRLDTIVISINGKVFPNEGNSIWIKDNQYLMVYSLNVHQKFIKNKAKIKRDFIKFDFIRKFFLLL